LKEINKTHSIIKVELPKINNMATEITENPDPEFIGRFFDVSDLMQKELELYEMFIDRSRDSRSYIDELLKIGRRVFPGSVVNSKITPAAKA
jgi:hypothetical protein